MTRGTASGGGRWRGTATPPEGALDLARPGAPDGATNAARWPSAERGFLERVLATARYGTGPAAPILLPPHRKARQ
jgi:hypothetical protein